MKNAVTGTVDLVLKEKKNVLYVPSALVFDMGSKKSCLHRGKRGSKGNERSHNRRTDSK